MEKSKIGQCFIREGCHGWKHLKQIRFEVPSGAAVLNAGKGKVGIDGSDRYICECLLERRVGIRVVPRNTLHVIRPCTAECRAGIFYILQQNTAGFLRLCIRNLREGDDSDERAVKENKC
jgi:hypothetical protein